MVKLGFHVSISGSISSAITQAQQFNCDTFQIFTRSPRIWSTKPIDEAVAQLFIHNLSVSGIWPVIDHMPYLPNLASEKPEIYDKSVKTLTDELNRCDILKIPYLVVHLGHHGKEGHKAGQEKVIDAITYALDHSTGETMILLENTANEKNTVGGTFKDIGIIADRIDKKSRVGFCFDTCHAAAAGYDIKGYGAETVFKWFEDEATGGNLSRLKVIHLNDMKGGIGSHLDRHEHLGLGTLGEDALHDILTFPKISDCAFIMETPCNDQRNNMENMEVARRLSLPNN